MIRARVPPIALIVVGLALTIGLANVWLTAGERTTGTWLAQTFLVLLAIAMLALAGAVTLDPGPIVLRRALAGSALVWLVILAGTLAALRYTGRPDTASAIVGALAVVDAVALVGLMLTSGPISTGPTDPLGRFGAVIVFAAAILMATGAAVLLLSLVRSVYRIVTQGESLDRLPWGIVVLVIVVPIVLFGLASLASHRAAGGTFYAQQTANRRNTVLLLISLVGIVAATVEIITVSVTFDPVPALWAAAIAGLVGLVAALAASRFGSALILESAGAKRADPVSEAALMNVVRELSLAANIPEPAVYIIEDGSMNAFATGRDPNRASVAVTRGLLDSMDREQLQGVIGHELGHIRNLDTRYALYVAVLVGLVALVTDGFLQVVIEGWRNGAFIWTGGDDAGSTIAGLAMGLLVGLFLLIVASLLRVFAPFFSALVQASTSREREFLADATSVEFTRNAAGLERALASLAADTDTLEAANRGTQHLWFRNPVKAGSDRRTSLLSTHPSLAARIDRLRALQGLAPLDADGTSPQASET